MCWANREVGTVVMLAVKSEYIPLLIVDAGQVAMNNGMVGAQTECS